MQSPHTPPPLPLPLGEDLSSRYTRPEQVNLCYHAACNGDLSGVKEQVQQLFYNPRITHEGEEPHPGWLYDSLLKAIQQDDVKIVQFLLDKDVTGGRFPVEPAVRARAFKVLELFLQNGLDINQPLGHNEPPVLSVPICTSDKEMVTWLLNHGANPNSRCDWDLTPASMAMFKAPIETINYLFQRGADPLYGELLQWAVIRNEPDGLDVVRQIVEKGVPIDEIKYANDPASYYWRKPFGLGTPLHRAADGGKVDIVKYLLERGANPLKLDSKGKTPRFWAEQKYAQTMAGKSGRAEELVQILKEAEERSCA